MGIVDAIDALGTLGPLLTLLALSAGRFPLTIDLCKDILGIPMENDYLTDDSEWVESEAKLLDMLQRVVVEEPSVTHGPVYIGDALLPQLTTILALYFSMGKALLEG